MTAPFSLAVLVPGCAAAVDSGVAVSGRVGPLVECLAELVDHTTILGYDPPPKPRLEDRVDYVVRSSRANVSFLSLGPKGTARGVLARRRRVRAIVRAHKAEWTALFLPLVNRRVGLVFNAAKGVRTFAQIGGHTPTVARSGERGFARLRQVAAATFVERDYRKIARSSLFFVNGEALLPFYDTPENPVEMARDAARREEHAFVALDRLNDDSPNFLIIGRMTAGKGVIESLDAFAALRATSMPGARLHVVGSGDADDEMRQHASRLGIDDAVIWHGWMAPGPELFSIYAQMDVMFLLSYAESLPKTIWEAMAHSVLVVATAVGAMPDVYQDGEDLLYVPVHDAQAAVDAVNRLAGDPKLRKKLLERGRASAAEASADSFAAHIMERVFARWPELKQ